MCCGRASEPEAEMGRQWRQDPCCRRHGVHATAGGQEQEVRQREGAREDPVALALQ